MWRNRIAQYVPSDQVRFEWPVSRIAAACCEPVALTHSPGAFVVPPSAGPQPGIHQMAREQAAFELRRRKRTSFTGLN